MQKISNIQNWPQTFPNIPIHGEILKNRDFFTLRKKNSKRKTIKISVFEIKKWSQTFLNMPIRGDIPKNPSLQQF